MLVFVKKIYQPGHLKKSKNDKRIIYFILNNYLNIKILFYSKKLYIYFRTIAK